MQTIAIWTEVREGRGMPEGGLRVMAQVLMAIVVAGRLVVGRRMPMVLLLLTVWLIALLSELLLLVALLLVRVLLDCCGWFRGIGASQARTERRSAWQDARC